MQKLLGLGLVVVGFLAGLAAVRAPRAEVDEAARADASVDVDAPRVQLDVIESELLHALRTRAPTRAYTATRRAQAALVRGRETLRTAGVAVENPCRASGAFPCVERPLDAFFERLDDLDEQRAARHAVVVAVGNSLIAADNIVDVVRVRLQERFGDGGRGLLLADRISELALRRRTGAGSGWTPHYLSQGPRGPAPFGLSGVAHVATSAAARASFALLGERRASVWLHEPSASGASDDIELRVDGKELPLLVVNAGGVVEVELPEGGERLELRAKRRGVVVQGVILQRERPGVVLDTAGLPAADSPRWLTADEDIVATQLGARDPALVMVMLGGVENRRIAWGRYRDEDVERDLRALLARMRAGAPAASCLVVGPIDAVEGMLDERVLGRKVRPFRERPQLSRVIALERRAALESGCAFFDLFEAMGGSGALRRFAQRGLLHDDHVHPRGFGLDILGELIADALLREWRRTAPDVPRRHVARALLERSRGSSEPALERTAALLSRLVRGEARRVTFGVVDESGRFRQRLRAALDASLGVARVGLDSRGRLMRVGVIVESAREGESYDVVVVAGDDPAPRRRGPVVVRLGQGSDDAPDALVAELLRRL